MLESKMLARLRAVREMFGRTGEGDEGETEAGFTLIELMVVLLIMGILLAIAIPTFLSVTGGAKKTSAQQNLTNAMTSATANYTNNDASFPVVATTPTSKPTNTALAVALHKTQESITFGWKTGTTVTGVTVALPTGPTKGKNVIAITELSKNVVIFTAVDGDGFCWVGALNETSTTVTGIPPGQSFTATAHSLTTATTAGTCTPTSYNKTWATNGGWKPNFGTVKTPSN